MMFRYKLTPYQKCILLILTEYGRQVTEEQIIDDLKRMGWKGLPELSPERVEIAWMELNDMGLARRQVEA